MLSSEQIKTHTIRLNAPVRVKKFSDGFEDLSRQEKLYAYHFVRASWEGALTCLHQVSYESPVIFCLAQFYFSGQSVDALRAAAAQTHPDPQAFDHFLAYFAGFLGNLGNYISFGQKKFVPNLEPEVFLAIYKSAPHFSEFEAAFGRNFAEVWGLVGREVFSLESPFHTLGLPSQGGTSGYMSRGLTEAELDAMNRFLEARKQSPLNTRCFKKAEQGVDVFEITVASEVGYETMHCFEGKRIRLRHGEFSEYLERMNASLEKAIPQARSAVQADMIRDYVAHFRTGDVRLHVESQKKWVTDKAPVIETNIGWIETYLDPQNIRAYFEGFVSISNKQRSAKYQRLVEAYEQIIRAAPWPETFCKDKFLRPDFTSLDIITFASMSCPIGINIPNYDRVRNDHGFKNVYLANCVSDFSGGEYPFCSPEDAQLLKSVGDKAFKLEVALHELIGHGSGKLFMEKEGGGLNFDPERTFDLLTGHKVTGHYKLGETWNSKFGDISCSYEECRADTCALFLGFEPAAYRIFDIADSELREAMSANVLEYMREAVLGLKLYNPDKRKWGQAHTQGAFVFLSFVLRNQDPEAKVLDVVLDEANQSFRFFLDRDRLMGPGRQIIGDLLRHLQQYKSSADSENGVAFYKDHSQVNEHFLKVRKIVLANQKPRRMDMYYELAIENGEVVEKKAEVSMKGLVESFHGHWTEPRNQLIQRVMREWAWRGNSATLRV